MSGYAARSRAPNVSQYIQGLNTVPTPRDVAAQQYKDNFGIDEDLSLFTNTEFFDFDLGTEIPDVTQPPLDYDPMAEERARRRTASYGQPQGKPADFNFTGDFQSLDFGAFPVGGLSDANFAHQPNPYPLQHQNGTGASSPTSSTSPTSAVGAKRKLDTLQTPGGPQSVSSIEEISRFAAEEDKRRRNTAASARFRVKKKQREQQLERTAKEMTDKVQSLESRVAQLEMENKWLKGLITEKNDSKNSSDFAELYRKFVGTDTKDERSTGESKDGVGTKGDEA